MTRRVAALGLAVLAVGVPVAAAASASTPLYTYSANADASSAEQALTIVQLSSEPSIDGRYPHAQAVVGSPSQARALASVFDPGALVESIPPQVRNCNTAVPQCHGGLPVPDYPFTIESSWPSQASANGNVAQQTVGPATVGAGSYETSVTASTAQARARGQSLDLPQAGVTLGDGEATAATAWDAASATATSTATSVLAQISIGGVVDVAQLRSTARATARAGAAGTAGGSLSLVGVTVAGVAATIDGDGVHLAGQSVPLDPAVGAARQALAQLQKAGTTVRLVPPSQVTRGGQVTYAGEALEVTETLPQGGPQATIDLGRLNLSGLAIEETALPLVSPLPFAEQLTTIPGTPGLPAVPGTAAGPGAPAASSTGPVRAALAALGLAPRPLLFGLFAIFELAMLGSIGALLWPQPPSGPAGPTLRPL